MTPWAIERAKELRAQHWTYRRIADQLGTSHVAVWNAFHRSAANAHKRQYRHNAKLKAADAGRLKDKSEAK